MQKTPTDEGKNGGYSRICQINISSTKGHLRNQNFLGSFGGENIFFPEFLDHSRSLTESFFLQPAPSFWGVLGKIKKKRKTAPQIRTLVFFSATSCLPSRTGQKVPKNVSGNYIWQSGLKVGGRLNVTPSTLNFIWAIIQLISRPSIS